MAQAEGEYEWWDVLDRLDFQFIDFENMADVRNRLQEILRGRPPSDRQTQMAFARGQQMRTRAIEMDYRVDRFFRRGQSVTMLRDSRGRFIAEGAANISDILERDDF
jgi:hypothetical protein